jgi:glycerol transport system ATP-binding protein
VRVSDAGRHRIVETRFGDKPVKLLVPDGAPIPAGKAHLAFDPAHTQVYDGGWIVGDAP